MSALILKTIMVLAAAVGLALAIKNKKMFAAIITAGMSVGIALVLIPAGKVQFAGFVIYIGFVALAFVYGLLVKERNRLARIVVSLMFVSIFLYWLWTLNHWHGNTLLFPIFTLLVFIFAIAKKVNLKTEFSFIVILVADAVVIIIEHWMKSH